MELVNNQTTHKLTTNQKDQINCMRKYLGVQYISEICQSKEINLYTVFLKEIAIVLSTIQK